MDVEKLRALGEETVEWINNFMQGYRALCVSTHLTSDAMWSDYAEQHKGIALRIEANPDKDSKFQLFKPITYRDKRPSLYDDAHHFMTWTAFWGS